MILCKCINHLKTKIYICIIHFVVNIDNNITEYINNPDNIMYSSEINYYQSYHIPIVLNVDNSYLSPSVE